MRNSFGTFTSAVFLALVSSPQAIAQEATKWTPCKAPVQIADRAYARIQQATSHSLRHERKAAFWDIHEFAHNCPEVSDLAAKLQKAGLGKDSVPQGQDIEILGAGGAFSLPRGCATGGCKLLVTEPGQGISQGMEGVRGLYMLEQSKDTTKKLPTYNWRQVDVKNLTVPSAEISGSPK